MACLVLLGLLGGNFIGTADLGGWFDIVRRLTPNGWLLVGWGQVMRGGSLTTIVGRRLLPGLRRARRSGGFVRAVEAVPMTTAGRDGRWSS